MAYCRFYKLHRLKKTMLNFTVSYHSKITEINIIFKKILRCKTCQPYYHQTLHIRDILSDYKKRQQVNRLIIFRSENDRCFACRRKATDGKSVCFRRLMFCKTLRILRSLHVIQLDRRSVSFCHSSTDLNTSFIVSIAHVRSLFRTSVDLYNK